ncbi:DUF4013 domain-containing protein [Natrarchaeobius chitinivorans]|uniref:DUF4013 domain-containing protein n=1 Tax=Natrarchaeobius chitinivorans TaxID=1679083 RepID=A0A3N6MSQ5_NATCH|nr:DUF4013 domain-containing protein [Natrarchaeobius chitinivorans]RQG97796.1 DUF4013 domain-containing protein [Natrarchaeobius chitinivorans]
MLTESIIYLKDSEDAWKTSIIGGVLLLFAFLVIPLFLVWGYVVRVLDRTARGDDEAPTFDDWGELTVEGAKAFVILLAYSLVPIVVGAFAAGGVVLVASGDPGVFGVAVVIAVGLLALAAALLTAYVVPAALAQFAAERRIAAGFDFAALRPVLRSATYATNWLLALGIVIVGSFVSGILGSIPFVGAVLGAIVAFYALVAAYYVIGHAWLDLHPIAVEGSNGESTSDRPAA